MRGRMSWWWGLPAASLLPSSIDGFPLASSSPTISTVERRASRAPEHSSFTTLQGIARQFLNAKILFNFCSYRSSFTANASLKSPNRRLGSWSSSLLLFFLLPAFLHPMHAATRRSRRRATTPATISRLEATARDDNDGRVTLFCHNILHGFSVSHNYGVSRCLAFEVLSSFRKEARLTEDEREGSRGRSGGGERGLRGQRGRRFGL